MSTNRKASDAAYLIFDVETVPDGELIRRVLHPGERISPEAAVERARAEALDASDGRSDFVWASLCYPIAVCVARVSSDFSLQAITALDAPDFRPAHLVEDFWKGLAHYQATLVSFHGRGFDLPVLELAAFRFGISARGHFDDRFGRRYRFGTTHLDLNDWLSNHGAFHLKGGLDMLAKLLGKPGDSHKRGKDILALHREGAIQQINDHCMFDVLDTYFVFLRTRVLTGEIELEQEQELVKKARAWIDTQTAAYPALKSYLEKWGEWKPWV